MQRKALEQYITETYAVSGEYPRLRYPQYEVFRHTDSRKWFAVLMEISKIRLGMEADGAADIVNLKCSSVWIGALQQEPGFYPAYHMNKNCWITAVLDGRIPDGEIRSLLEHSYQLTAGKTRKHPADSR